MLASAARAFGPRLIAIVLPGRLDGGARGVREVKRRGGRVLVQSPDSAVGASMPNAALATGCVDFALTPDRLGEALVAFCSATGAAAHLLSRYGPKLDHPVLRLDLGPEWRAQRLHAAHDPVGFAARSGAGEAVIKGKGHRANAADFAAL